MQSHLSMEQDDFINQQIRYLIQTTKAAKFYLSEIQISQFKNYLSKLIEWNKRINLVSKNDEQKIVERHFLESIAILNIIDLPQTSHLIDVGTGAGFPGLPIKIMKPDLHITLLDSKRFKILFLRDIVSTLKISNINIVRERAEIAWELHILFW